jgi:hypothetical protein
MPNTFADLAFNFPLGRSTYIGRNASVLLTTPCTTVYTNSLLSSLNMRQALRHADKPTVSSGFTVNIQRTTFTDAVDENAPVTGNMQPKY